MTSDEAVGTEGGAQLVITIAAARAPAVLVAELVDVVGRHAADGEVLVGVDDTSGKLGVFVAGVAGSPAPAAPAAAKGSRREPRTSPPKPRAPRQLVGAGIVPVEWLTVLQALHANGDTLGDLQGRANRELVRLMGLSSDQKTLQRVSAVVRKMESHHYVARVQKGKRTYEISLEPAGLAIVDQQPPTEPADDDPAPVIDITGGGSVEAAPVGIDPIGPGTPIGTTAPGRDGAHQDRLRHAAAAAI